MFLTLAKYPRQGWVWAAMRAKEEAKTKITCWTPPRAASRSHDASADTELHERKNDAGVIYTRGTVHRNAFTAFILRCWFRTERSMR